MVERILVKRVWRGPSMVLGVMLLTVLLVGLGPAARASAAAPTIAESLTLASATDSAEVRASVNPGGTATGAYVEYGSSASLGGRIPPSGEISVGSGSEPVPVTVPIEGLDEGAVYYFRFVAVNADGTTPGPIREFSTLNDEGLAWGRHFELVSPLDKGATGQAAQGLTLGLAELQSQVSTDGNAINYVLSYGVPGGTYGGEVPYRGLRSASGWASGQLAPSPVGQHGPIGPGTDANFGKFNVWLSDDTSCGFLISSIPLTDDPEGLPVIEAGGFNLYRRNADGSYDLITNLARTVLGSGGSNALSAYRNVVASEDCERVIFETQFGYPGVPLTTGSEAGAGANAWRIYEWENGILRNPVGIPGGSGTEYPTAAKAGVSATSGNRAAWHALSEDGSRFFFTTNGAGTSVPLGREAIFLREDGQPTKEITASQTATATTGNARFQMATPDGSQAFFIARYGIAANATSTGAAACTPTSGDTLGVGCDLYRYSAATGVLTDLSASSNPEDTAGASVAGVLDASDDGSRVYFAAKGQLVPGKGQTYAQNTAVATRGYNIYLSKPGGISFVANVTQVNFTGATGSGLLVSTPNLTQSKFRASRTTPDGSHLLFQSDSKVTGPSGQIEAYLYSAATDTVECVSCRRDGSPSLGNGGILGPLEVIGRGGDDYNHPQRALSDDGRTVFFAKWDPLAPGASSGTSNLYEWRDGQVSLLAGELEGVTGTDPQGVVHLGASSDGSSVFIRSRDALVPWDTDGRNDVYVARIGGGFDPPPPPPPPPCDPLSEAACQGPGTAGPTSNTPQSSTLQGAGNAQGTGCKPSQVKRDGRCVSKRSLAQKACAKKKGKAKQRCIRNHIKQMNRFNNNGGAGK